MKLVIGLGNPGKEYERTRHNAGYLALQHFTSNHNLKFKLSTKFYAHISEHTAADEKIILAMPTTSMNCSGDSVGLIAKFYQIQPNDLLVVYDELDLPFGTIRAKIGGSSAGHRGVKSITNHIDRNFYRLRIGIGNEFRANTPADKFVLNNFSKTEQSNLPQIFKLTDQLISRFISGNLTIQTETIKI